MATPQPSLLPPPTEINNTHKVYSVAIAVIIMGIVAGLFVIMRLALRYKTRTFGPDDWAIVPALLFYLGWTAMAAYANLNAGVGKPLWEITVLEYSRWFKTLIGAVWLYPAMTFFIRCSILLLYKRIFAKTVPRVKLAVHLLLGLQVVYLVVFSILPAFICRPLNMAWHPLERQKYFNDYYYIYMNVALYATSMSLDVILLVFPLWPVMQLQTTARKKFEVATLFMLGAGASVAAAYKLAIWTIEIHRYTHINPIWLNYQMSTLIPPEFDTFGVTFWIPGQVEPTVALIGTSLPAFRQFLSKLKPAMDKVSKMLSSSGQTTPKGSAVNASNGGITIRRNFDVKQEYELRESNDSQVALHHNFGYSNDI